MPVVAAPALVSLVSLALAWSGEAHVGAALDYAGWGDGRRFLVVEPALLLEGRQGPLSFALAASMAGDLYRQGEGGRWPPTLRLGARLGIARPTWHLRLGPVFHGNDRGGRGYRAALVPLGNADWQFRPAGGRLFYSIEAGGRATQATVGEGLHLGLGWRLAAGRAVREVLGALYLGELVGLSARLSWPSRGGDWILGAQLGADLLQHGHIFERRALGFGASLGRGFGRPATTAPATPAPCPCRHNLTAALAGLWQRSFAAEYEGTLGAKLSLFAALGVQDRLTETSIRLRGPSLRLGLRVFPFAHAPTGWWVGWDALTLGWVRASGWRSAVGGPLGPYTDSQGVVLASGLSSGYAWQWRGVILSPGLGAALGLRGYDGQTGSRRSDVTIGPTVRLNLGVAWQ